MAPRPQVINPLDAQLTAGVRVNVAEFARSTVRPGASAMPGPATATTNVRLAAIFDVLDDCTRTLTACNAAPTEAAIIHAFAEYAPSTPSR